MKELSKSPLWPLMLRLRGVARRMQEGESSIPP